MACVHLQEELFGFDTGLKQLFYLVDLVIHKYIYMNVNIVGGSILYTEDIEYSVATENARNQFRPCITWIAECHHRST